MDFTSHMVTAFFHNMTTIIAVMFIGIKLKEWLRNHHHLVRRAVVVVFFGVFSFLLMLQSYSNEQGIIIDLRFVPLLFVSYRYGWKIGLLSAVLPLLYRWHLGGPTMWLGMFNSILLPVVIGGAFSEKWNMKQRYILLNVNTLLKMLALFFTVKWCIEFYFTALSVQQWTAIILSMIAFTVPSWLALAFMTNSDSQNHFLKKELRYLSTHDATTRLPNLRYFISEAEKVIQRENSVSVGMIDVDWFKNYNDTHGHPAGDELLRELALIFRRCIDGDPDIVARYGGEEFVFLVANKTQEQLSDILENIRRTVSEHPFKGREKQPDGRITVSIGLSSPMTRKKLDDFLSEADQALYSAKRAGRNTCCVYH